jgi:hypothetical protein
MEVSLKGILTSNKTIGDSTDIGSTNTSRALKGRPGNVSMWITRSISLEKTPLRSRSIELSEYTHHRGTTCSFLSTIQAKTITPMIADPTRPMHVYA